MTQSVNHLSRCSILCRYVQMRVCDNNTIFSGKVTNWLSLSAECCIYHFFVPDSCVVYENVHLELFPLLRLFQSGSATISNYAVPDPIMMIQHSMLLLLLLHCCVTFLLRSSQSLWAWWTASFVVFSSWSILSALSLASSFSFLSLKKIMSLILLNVVVIYHKYKTDGIYLFASRCWHVGRQDGSSLRLTIKQKISVFK